MPGILRRRTDFQSLIPIFSTLLFSLLLMLSARPVHAGRIQPDLVIRISNDSDNRIPVWIKLRDQESPSQRVARMSAAAELQQLDRPTANRQLISDMTAAHQDAQASLKSELERLESIGQAAKIAPRWIVNLIEAEVLATEIPQLAARADVEEIFLQPTIVLIAPTELAIETPGKRAQRSVAGSAIEPGMNFVKVRQAWAQGYTGKGRLVCSFDSGVRGAHDALRNSWRGIHGDSAAAWFDPVRETRSPQNFGTGVPFWHGTHTMGTMVGRSGADTVGIAPDAEWISAAVIDVIGAPILQAFEWAANPDGDLNTISDVPDVINHSWGILELGCTAVFDDAIDLTEALGIVNIFAAGNEGSAASTIRYPAGRARDSIDCFAVGNLNLGPPVTISAGSSRGPSDCNGAMKPNVSAPGTTVRSTYPPNTFANGTGTSMAAPHVSGLVALMRQKNPNATVREIKTAILNSTIRTGFTPTPVPNTSAGWGVIDCEAALNAIPPAASPILRVYSFASSPVTAGVSVTGRVVLKNTGGQSVSNLTGTVVSSSALVTVTDAALTYGTVTAGDTLRSVDELGLFLSPELANGSIITLSLILTGTGFVDTLPLYVQVEPQSVRQISRVRSNRARFTFTNYGVYGLGDGSMMPLDSVGYKLDNGLNELYESAIYLSKSISQVSSGTHTSIYEAIDDFTPAPAGNITFISPSRFGGEEARVRLTDNNATNPLGVVISQELFTLPAPNDDIILMRYIFENPTSTDHSGSIFSLFMDWDAKAQYNQNAGGYSAPDRLLWTALNTSSVLSNYRGVVMVSDTPSSALTAQASTLVYPLGSSGIDGFTTDEMYASARAGFSSAATFSAATADICQVLSASLHLPATIGRDTVVVALVAGDNFSALQNAANRARGIVFDCCDDLTGDVDCNGSGPDLIDLTVLVNSLFIGFDPLCCESEADVDSSGGVDLIDLTILVDNLFISFEPLPNCY